MGNKAGLLRKIPQQWPMPKRPKPIVFIGAGGIVRAAHLPTYRKAGFHNAGVYDKHLPTAEKTARDFRVPHVFRTLAEAARVSGVVFDVAVPATGILSVLKGLPNKAVVLIQKPLGVDLKSAKRILALCRTKKLTAAVNFQCRFSPNMMVLRDLLERGALGVLTDAEIRVNLFTPWGQWRFLEGIPRMEILYHSIHYLDLLRSLLGEPKDVYCRTYRNPRLSPRYRDAAHSAILNYGPSMRCALYVNHAFVYGPRHSMVQLKVEGMKGVAIANMQQKLNSARDAQGHDWLEVCFEDSKWMKVPLKGDWFFDAFQGPMANLQRYASGEDKVLRTRVEDATKTMTLVEALYLSARKPGTKIPQVI